MERHFKAHASKIQLFAMIAIFLQGCGVVNQSSPSKSCSTGQAILQVHDTFIQRVCGCTEGTGSATTGLNCTVTHGTSVYFYYPGITQAHYILVGAGGTGTPVYRDPATGSSSNFVDVVQFNSTSTGINYTDQLTGNGGLIIVQ